MPSTRPAATPTTTALALRPATALNPPTTATALNPPLALRPATATPTRPLLAPTLRPTAAVALRLALAIAALVSPACAAVDPELLELQPTLDLQCQHPDAWFEGIYPTRPDSTELTAYPAAAPHRPGPLTTRLSATTWDGSTGPATQTACADACVGLAMAGFHHRCPDTGWQVTALGTLAPPPAALPELLDPDACYPDSACQAAHAAPIGLALRGPSRLAGPTDHLATAETHLELRLPGADLRHPLQATASYSPGACEAAPCSFYLASLTLDDASASTRAHLGLVDLKVPVVLEDLRLELLRPALADLDPVTGALEFPAGALELRIQLAIAAGAQIDPGPRELLLRNPFPISGRIVDGALTLAAEFPLASLGSARLDLELQPTAHPPIADFTPPSRLVPGPLPQDPRAPSDLHAARDPDGDLAALIWVLDGTPGARELPPGAHDLALWVADRRGALARSATHSVLVHE